MQDTQYTPTSYTPSKQKMVGIEKEISIMNHAITENLPVLLVGETGTGKTSLVRSLAAEYGASFRRVNLNGGTTVDEFVGKILLEEGKKGSVTTVWHDGILVDAMRKGHWLLVDEINAALPEILFSLHSLLDDDHMIVLSEHTGEVVRPHPVFRFFASMNPPGEYAGTKELNKALLSRFPMVVHVKVPKPDMEAEIIRTHVPSIGKEQSEALVELANDLRLKKHEGEIEYYCSTRDLLHLARLIFNGFSTGDAFRLAMLGKAMPEERQAISVAASLYLKGVDPEGPESEIITQKNRPIEIATKMFKEQVVTREFVDRYLRHVVNQSVATVETVEKDERIKDKAKAYDKFKEQMTEKLANDFHDQLTKHINDDSDAKHS